MNVSKAARLLYSFRSRELKIMFISLILSGMVFSMIAKEVSPGDHALSFKSSYDGTMQPYRLFIPSDIKKEKTLPLLVVLHGKGVNQDAWFDYTPVKEFAEKHGYIVAAPHARGDSFYRGAGEQDVLDIIKLIREQFAVDQDRIYLMGHSMGGWGSWWIGLRHPDLFAAIFPMAGHAPMELLQNARHLSPFIIHDTDDPIVPVTYSRNSASTLANLGISFRYREEQGYGHSSKIIGDNFPRLFDWMKNHKRISKPRRVTFITPSPKFGKAYWAYVIETEQYPKLGSLDAKWGANNRLIIKTRNIKRLGVLLDQSPCDLTKPVNIVINQEELFVKAPPRRIILSRKDKGEKWRLSLKSTDFHPEFDNPVLFEIPRDDARVTSSTILTNVISKHLVKELGVDLCLFLSDSFQFPGGALTREACLDLYVYPEERLAKFKYSGEAIPTVITMLPRFFPEERFDPGTKTYQVAAPVNIAGKMNLQYEILPEGVGEYVLKALSK